MPVRSGKKTAFRANPIGRKNESSMGDDEVAAPSEGFVRQTLLPKEKAKVNTSSVELSPFFDVNVDPRYRHKEELKGLIEILDGLKAERETFGKDARGKAQRKEYTEKIAHLERIHRERTTAETEKFLEGKSREEILALPYTQEALDKERFKKEWKTTRKTHKYGLTRA